MGGLWPGVVRKTISTSPFPVSAGLAQGDPLSPILFILYFEPLLRFLHADPRYSGIAVLGLRLRGLAYADDLLALVRSVSATQAPLSRIATWCRDWLMDINTGTGKTEAVDFTLGLSDAEATAHEPLYACPATGGSHSHTHECPRVQWATSYKYLGNLTRHDLMEAGEAPHARMASRFARFLSGNRLIRRTDEHHIHCN